MRCSVTGNPTVPRTVMPAMCGLAGSAPFGDLRLKVIRRSHVEAWVKQMSARLAPTTIKPHFGQAGKGAFYGPGFANDFLPAAPCHPTRADLLIIEVFSPV